MSLHSSISIVPRKSLPLSEVYRLLEPGPVVLVTTALKGQANVMTMSWHTMMEFEPTLIDYVVSNRNFIFNVLKATTECISTMEIAVKVCGLRTPCKSAKRKRLI